MGLRPPELRLYLHRPEALFSSVTHLTAVPDLSLFGRRRSFNVLRTSGLAYAPTPNASMLCLFASRFARLTCERTASGTKLVLAQSSIALRLKA
jgi:hypothetical protein